MRRSADFRQTVRAGVRVGRPTLVLHAAYRTGWTTPLQRASTADSGSVRVGFVVGRTVGNAVNRNRVRRRLRHLAAAQLPGTPPSVSVVVRALPRAATAPDEVPSDFAAAWPQALERLARGPATAGVRR